MWGKRSAWTAGTALAGMLIGSTASAADAEALEEVIVTATRLEQRLADVPGGVTVVGQRDLQLGRQQLGLDEALVRVPGVFFQDRYNFAQDLRIAVRGFGARSNFGIRGIKVYVDDIPSTLPDGQSGVDDIDLGSLARAELIRGPSSSIYGSAAGGVLSLYTEDGPATPFAEAGITAGAYDQQKYQLKAGGQSGDLNWLLDGSYLNYDGYREHSEVDHALFNSKLRYGFDGNSDLTVVFNAVDSPVADDPGALTAADAQADPRRAQPRNLSSHAGESLQQQKLGWVYRREFGGAHELRLRNYYTWRDFRNLLPIGTHIPFSPIDGVVEFGRFFYGGGLQYSYTGDWAGRANRMTAGFDIDVQKDDRQRYVNSAGVQGPLTFDQLEQARAYGLYLRDAFALTDTVELTLGGRFDWVDLSVHDRFLANGDQSSALDFKEFSPSVGVTWNAWRDVRLFASYGTAFETPTFTELGTPAQDLNANLGGFNDVKPQTAQGIEIGARGTIAERLRFEIAAYHMQVEDEISNVVSVANRAFFENADTDRTGVEVALVAEPVDGLRLTGAYTWSDFTFGSFPSQPAAIGMRLPGIPGHQFYAEAGWFPDSGFYAAWDVLFVGDLYTDNLNTEVSPRYAVSNLRVGREFRFGAWSLSPFAGVNNLFDEAYFGNVRLNAIGGRSFEPAPGRNAYGGVTLRREF